MYGFIGIKGHSGEIAGLNNVRPLFLLIGFFSLAEILFSRNRTKRFWGLIFGTFMMLAEVLGPVVGAQVVGMVEGFLQRVVWHGEEGG